MKTWIMWSSMLLTMMWSACSSGQGEKTQGMIDVSSAFENLTELKVSQLGKNVRYVPLETTDESLIGATAALHLLKDKILVVTEGKCMSFDKTTGKYLGNIGHTGDDPEGYTYATCYVNPKDETLHFFRMQGKKFLQYNNDGEYIGEVPTPASLSTSYYPLFLNSKVIAHPIGVHNLRSIDRLYQFDYQGIIQDSIPITIYDTFDKASKNLTYGEMWDGLAPGIERPYGLLFKNGGLKTEHENKYIGIYPYRYPSLWLCKDEIHFHEALNDTIFQIDRNRITPYLIFHTGNHHFPLEKKGEKEASEGTLVITDVMETSRWILFHCTKDIYGEPESYQGMYDKENGEVRLTKENDGFIDDIHHFLPIHPEAYGAKGEWGTLLSVEQIQTFQEEHPDFKMEGVLAPLKDLDFDANPVVVIVEP